MRILDNLYWYREKGPFDANTYLIKGDISVLIDPGLRAYLELRFRELEDDRIDRIDVIAVTHLHPDHYDAIIAMKEAYNAKIALHISQSQYRNVMIEESSRFFGMSFRHEFHADMDIRDTLKLSSDRELRILHTPGHSPDSICIYSPDERFLITGDLIFDHGIGRTDLPFGREADLRDSIHRISMLNTELLLPGHGNIIRGRAAIESNYEYIKRFYL